MVAPWTYKDIERGIDEADWLTQYVRNNYNEGNGGLHRLKEYAVVKFKKKHPKERRIVDGQQETREEADEWYALLTDVSVYQILVVFVANVLQRIPKWINNRYKKILNLQTNKKDNKHMEIPL